MLDFVGQIILAAFFTERLIDGLHKFYWTKKLKKYLVGNEEEAWQGDGVVTVEKPDKGILRSGAWREYVTCKFCQSWGVAWAVSLVTVWIWSGWSWHWVWMGLVVGLLANKSHDVGEKIKR